MGAGVGLFSMFGPVKAMGRFALRSVFHIVYPPTCAACGRMRGADGALCPDCWRDVGFIERPYCEVLGIPLSLDHGDGVVSGEAIANPPAFDRLRAVAIHDGVARKLVHRLKCQDRTDLALSMASWICGQVRGGWGPAITSFRSRCIADVSRSGVSISRRSWHDIL